MDKHCQLHVWWLVSANNSGLWAYQDIPAKEKRQDYPELLFWRSNPRGSDTLAARVASSSGSPESVRQIRWSPRWPFRPWTAGCCRCAIGCNIESAQLMSMPCIGCWTVVLCPKKIRCNTEYNTEKKLRLNLLAKMVLNWSTAERSPAPRLVTPPRAISSMATTAFSCTIDGHQVAPPLFSASIGLLSHW